IAVSDPAPELFRMGASASAVLQPWPGDARFPLAHLLRQELRDAPGRASYTLRLTLSCAVLITLFMTLQIPFLAVALIVVFYVRQPN
ncbi:hypothetical protein K4H04_23715, partial [Mycobacterium tuberculosis]|nr:hypothetical protein [Mycobacterium tuberculosis]